MNKKISLIGLLISIFVFIASFIVIGIVDEESTAALILSPIFLLSIPAIPFFAILSIVYAVKGKKNEEDETQNSPKVKEPMDWHNFKVIFLYAVVVCVVLLIFGQPVWALLALAVYSAYGLIDVLRDRNYATKWNNMISHSVDEELKEILLCHITRRHPKINKKTIKKFITDINAGNYTIQKETITAIHSEPPTSDEGYTYYIEFDNNGKLYYMSAARIHDFHVGDVMWCISAGSHSANVVKGAKGYVNLLSTFVVTKNKTTP